MTRQSKIKALTTDVKIIKCSLTDHFVFRIPVSVAFFYPQAIAADLIIEGLQGVLKDFPIFAGVLTKQDNQLFINCNNQGISLNIAYYNANLSEQLTKISMLKAQKLIDVIHPSRNLKEQGPLLTIKLNYFNDGMVIGYCWHHSVGDMSTFMTFLKALSHYCQGKSYEAPLIVSDRDAYLQNLYSGHKNLNIEQGNLTCLTMSDSFDFLLEVCKSKKYIYFYFTHDEINAMKGSLSKKSGKKLSRNDALCSHLLNIIRACRSDKAQSFYTSIVMNMRKRLNMPAMLVGNFLDAISIQYNNKISFHAIAEMIHTKVKTYQKDNYNPFYTLNFVNQNGGLKNINRFIPRELLPRYKNLIFTNWTNFDVYAIDFGVVKPNLFLPLGKSPISWVSSIVEGFNNKGLIVSLVLPSKIEKRLLHADMLKQIHQYREHLNEDERKLLEKHSWCY